MDEASAAEGVRDRILEEAQQKARLMTSEGHRRIEEARAKEAAAEEAARNAKAFVQDARRERDRILSDARRDLRRLRSLGTMFRALWDSLRQSAIRRSIRQEMQALIDREAAKAASTLRRLRDESLRRQAIEIRLADAIQSVSYLGRERDELRRERDCLLGEASAAIRENRPNFP